MIPAIILSAGESSRMGRPKALLPVDGVRFIEKIVTTLRSTRVGDIIVVLGHNAEEMREKIADLSVTIVINPDYRQGQLSSLIAALRNLQAAPARGRIDGVLVHLVDHPFIDRELVDRMIEKFFETGKSIVVPTYGGRRGHPVIFSRSLFPEILAAPLNQGAKAVVSAHRDDTLEIPTSYEGVTIDIDTPEEYRRNVKPRTTE
ncbi:MAG TPA: nucleotidyltransferase family protein [Candidatus Binatia bacterium]|jgi:molybdenum cofactor cytidylyltransferase